MSAHDIPRAFFERLVDTVRPPRDVYAHCDIPCGIYDPHEAQLAALTVLRMDQLIADLAAPPADAAPEVRATYAVKLARYTSVKEQHAERVKHEVRVIWGDYFTADHAKQYPQVNELPIRILRQASKTRQSTKGDDAQELLKLVLEFAELFWKTKGAPTKRQPSLQKSGGELVVPQSA